MQIYLWHTPIEIRYGLEIAPQMCTISCQKKMKIDAEKTIAHPYVCISNGYNRLKFKKKVTKIFLNR
jgi:hypothetical protein